MIWGMQGQEPYRCVFTRSAHAGFLFCSGPVSCQRGLRTSCLQNQGETRTKAMQKNQSTDWSSGIRAEPRSWFPAVFITELRPWLGIDHTDNTNCIFYLVCDGSSCVTQQRGITQAKFCLHEYWRAHSSVGGSSAYHSHIQKKNCLQSSLHSYAHLLARLGIWALLGCDNDKSNWHAWKRGKAYFKVNIHSLFQSYVITM